MAVEVTLKQIGNSLGFILPKEEVNKKNLKPKERFLVEVIKKADLKKDFGSLPRKLSGQKFKDLVRSEWK